MTPWLQDADVTLYHGDVLQVLRDLPAESVDCCVTSPPYWGLRSYLDNEHADKPLELGLEPTPEEYVTRMVKVFREVRRVLAPHGTVWLNLGDSYAGGGRGGQSDEKRSENWQPTYALNGLTPSGLKPKDLVGIPWMLAKALQAPYYTGRIKDERDRIWLAATIEAEGCLFIHKRKAGQPNGQGYERKNDSYGAGLEVASTDRVIAERCMEITGLGSICEQTPEQNDRRKQTIYRWNLRSNVCREVIRELYPHFLAKQHEARLLLGCPSSGEKAERAHRSLKAIHQGGTPDIDFAAPESMFEGGWYLRSDIIWSKKPNPMPESVTDRPTKAHEYVFLLSKQPRYFFDQEAVREKALSMGYEDTALVSNAPGWSGNPNVHGEKGHALPGAWTNGGGRNIRSVWEMEQTGRPKWSMHTLDDCFFTTITTEEQAYWLGFLYADAHVGERHVDLQLSDKDREHILRFRDALASSYEPKDTGDGRIRVFLSSKRMAQDLLALGIKTQMRIPDMPEDLVRHFVRGLFDGDGSAWKYLPSGRTKWRYGAQFLGTERMLTAIRDILGLKAKPKLGRGIHRISIASAAELERLYEYLYDGATVYLERKRREFPQAQHVASDVWPIATQPYPEAHFATFPEELARRCIAAGCPEQVCRVCGKASERIVDVSYGKSPAHGKGSIQGSRGVKERDETHLSAGMANKESIGGQPRVAKIVDTLGFTDCGHDDYRPGLTLDPFIGSGTVAHVARKLGRHAMGIDLSESYLELAARRLQQQSLFADSTLATLEPSA